MTVEEEREAHVAQLAEYDDVVRRLREVQRRVSRALDRCAQRRGRGPRPHDMQLAESLRERADWLWTLRRACRHGVFP
jgi:hypothetical protein